MSILGGRVIDPVNHLDEKTDVHILASKIIAIGEPPNTYSAQHTIDASNHIVIPGIVDLRARLREPGFENKGCIASETKAAVAGGITSLCCPPDTDPVIDNTAVVELIRLKAEQAGLVNVYTLGALTQQLQGQQLSEMRELKDAGCVGVSNALSPVENTLVMRRALEYAASHDITVFIHPFDRWLTEEGCAHEGDVSSRLGLSGIPESAETIALARDLMLIELTGARVHFCELSSARAVEMVKNARDKGLAVSADVTAHHLQLTDMDIGFFDSNCHVFPPFRTQRDLNALRRGVMENTLTAVVSDHQPHDSDAKLAPFAETEPGLSGLETLLPLSLKMAEELNMALPDIIARLTIQPANILNINAGSLGVGKPADVCIFDPTQHWKIDKAQLLSMGKNTPFHNWELKGLVKYTIKSGKLVYTHS